LAGLAVFFLPIRFGGGTTVPLDAANKLLGAGLGDLALPLVCVICIVTATLSVVQSLRARRVHGGGGWAALYDGVFRAPAAWLAIRLVGGATAALYLSGSGPAWLMADAVSRSAFESVGVVVMLIYVTSAFCLPLITDYGVMEFFGVLARPYFQAVFRLPGRASLDAIASWVSSGPIAILITLRQYEGGYYTAREAIFIATNFHIVSLPFTLVIAEVAGISRYYFQWYGSLVVIGLLIAWAVRRLPPWSLQRETYFCGETLSAAARDDQSREAMSTGGSAWRRAVHAGVVAAQQGASPQAYVADVLANLLRTVFGLICACIGVVVLANLLLEYTPLFRWLSAPFVPVLEGFGLGDAATAAPGVIIGFLDQFLAATVAARVESVETRFVLASLSVAQVIYLSNVGVMLMRSSLEVRFRDLLGMFAVRTALGLPLFALAAHLII
jgi:nucleoside recognition membrane protein YjiH